MVGRSGRRGQRGAALVEFVLIAPLVFALILAVLTGGIAYTRKLSMVDAVREGARYGASLQVPSAGITAWESNVKSRIAQVSGGEITTDDVCAKLVYATGATDCGVSDPPGAASESTIRLVKISVAKGTRVEFFFFTLAPNLTAKLASRYERDTG